MKCSGDYYVTVIEDTRINQLIGSATLVIEHKFIHNCGLVCMHLIICNSNISDQINNLCINVKLKFGLKMIKKIKISIF